MSEKQFKLSSETVLQYQIMDNDTDLNENEVVDLLNEYENKCNKFLNEIQRLNKVIDLMEYQMKAQDRIIKEYEDGD